MDVSVRQSVLRREEEKRFIIRKIKARNPHLLNNIIIDDKLLKKSLESKVVKEKTSCGSQTVDFRIASKLSQEAVDKNDLMTLQKECKKLLTNKTDNLIKPKIHNVQNQTQPNIHSINYNSSVTSKFHTGQKKVGVDNSAVKDPKSDYYASLLAKERIEALKTKAVAAANEGKTFLIASNTMGSNIIRKYLTRKGWFEKLVIPEEKLNQCDNHQLTRYSSEAIAISQALKHKPVGLIWTDSSVNWSFLNPSTKVNKFPQAGKSLSTKTGLLKYLESQVWIYEPGLSFVKYPRTFSIYDESDLNYFASQYRINSCVNMLKKFCAGMLKDKKEIISDYGTINIKNIDFAIQRTCEYLNAFDHAYVDTWNASVVSNNEWLNFLTNYYNFAHQGRLLKNTEKYELDKLITSAGTCLNQIRNYWPEVDFEGYENVWIIKPQAQSCGRGIVIMKTLTEIMHHCARMQAVIVQKYIEKPFLIYNTKFDIRQWFLVTDSCPLKIYMYKKCYVRFCSKEYSLNNLHESVHLSNNSIQYKYESHAKHNIKLPKQNMWDCDQFQDYLKLRGVLPKWDSVIVPGMEQGIIGAMLASQESINKRPNSFNLYGADFLLTEELTPLLIEINGNPCMRSTTNVTAKWCPAVLEDTIKVVTTENPGPNNIGFFRLIYSQRITPEQTNASIKDVQTNLLLVGKRAPIHYYQQYPHSTKKSIIGPDLETHWDSRTLNYNNLNWYLANKLKWTTTSLIDPNLGYLMPKHPGDPTPDHNIIQVMKQIDPPAITKWMEDTRAYIAKRISSKPNEKNNEKKDNEKPNEKDGHQENLSQK